MGDNYQKLAEQTDDYNNGITELKYEFVPRKDKQE